MQKVEELLKLYPQYKHAVTVYERHKPMPAAGIANYSAMPSGSGAPEFFFDRVGKSADMGRTTFEDLQDYFKYKVIVVEIEGALDTLTDEQQAIIKLRWMKGINLEQIAPIRRCSVRTVKSNHKMALARLNTALRFTKLEDIETHKYVISL